MDKSEPGPGGPRAEKDVLRLHSRHQGAGPPVLILHGLFGSLDNWATQSRLLMEDFEVLAVDLRNHGRSPHHDVMTYPAMASDVADFVESAGRGAVHCVGHSLGGKVAMQLALTEPARIRKLVVVDISPAPYPLRHEAAIAGMRSLRLADVASRTDADRQLSVSVPEPMVRAFLLKNLIRAPGGGYQWRVNLEALDRAQSALSAAVAGDPFEGPILFLRGESSDYLPAELTPAMRRLFPRSVLKTIRHAGHWPHFDQAGAFHQVLRRFLLEP
jgi:esterase